MVVLRPPGLFLYCSDVVRSIFQGGAWDGMNLLIVLRRFWRRIVARGVETFCVA